MKLATYRDGSRDGQLVVVSRDLTHAQFAAGVATRLQQVLDDWNFLSPQLQQLSQMLNQGKGRHAFPFDPRLCMAPLPRAYQRVDAWAYAGHLERICPASRVPAADKAACAPTLWRGGSDDLAGPCDDIVCASPEQQVDFEAGLAVVTGDVPMGTSAEAAIDAIRLLMLANGVVSRELAPAGPTNGPGFLQGRPSTAFSPVAVTPDELPGAWQGGRLQRDLEVIRNGDRFALLDAGAGMTFDFGRLIAHLGRTRNVRAGSIICSGPVSNEDVSRGCACIAEMRALQTPGGDAVGPGYLQPGDTIRLEMKGPDGHSLFGAIEQKVMPAEPR